MGGHGTLGEGEIFGRSALCSRDDFSSEPAFTTGSARVISRERTTNGGPRIYILVDNRWPSPAARDGCGNKAAHECGTGSACALPFPEVASD